jgi:hypothetical protein
MGTARTPIGRPPISRITQEMVTLYVRLCAIEGDEQKWRQHCEARIALHSMLGRKVWEHTVFDVDVDEEEPPNGVKRDGDFRIKDWTVARDLRRELERLAEEEA